MTRKKRRPRPRRNRAPVAYDQIRPYAVIAQFVRLDRTFHIATDTGRIEHDTTLYLLTDDRNGMAAEIARFDRTGPTQITADVTTALAGTNLELQAILDAGVSDAVNAMALALFDGIRLDPALEITVLPDPEVQRRFASHGW